MLAPAVNAAEEGLCADEVATLPGALLTASPVGVDSEVPEEACAALRHQAGKVDVVGCAAVLVGWVQALALWDEALLLLATPTMPQVRTVKVHRRVSNRRTVKETVVYRRSLLSP